MNSIIQCISATKPLTNFFLSEEYIKISEELRDKDIIQSYYELLKIMWSGSDAIEPVAFHATLLQAAPQLRGYMKQHDSHEALTYILDNLHEQLNVNKINMEYKEDGANNAYEAYREHLTRENSYIWKLFGGQLKSILSCPSCQNTKFTFDHFTSLSLEIPTTSCDIYDVLNKFTNRDKLEWCCSECSTVSQTNRTFRISKLPRILVIHLKRFSQEFDGNRKKIRTAIKYPIVDLDMSNYVVEIFKDMCWKYDLYAISHHVGELNSGHYTSFVLHNNEWHYCNDSNVRVITSKKELLSNGGYILFYKRQDVPFE